MVKFITAERLRQYKSLKEEIKELFEQIDKRKSSYLAQGSDEDFLYIKHNMKVEKGWCEYTCEY